jgi:alkylation response protein AidB-like acyl-CoA dehydrogenase
MPQLRERLFSSGDELCCFVAARSGSARRVPGGYLIKGEWRYASGCLHARWLLCGVAPGDDCAGGHAVIDLHDDI